MDHIVRSNDATTPLFQSMNSVNKVASTTLCNSRSDMSIDGLLAGLPPLPRNLFKSATSVLEKLRTAGSSCSSSDGTNMNAIEGLFSSLSLPPGIFTTTSKSSVVVDNKKGGFIGTTTVGGGSSSGSGGLAAALGGTTITGGLGSSKDLCDTITSLDAGFEGLFGTGSGSGSGADQAQQVARERRLLRNCKLPFSGSAAVGKTDWFGDYYSQLPGGGGGGQQQQHGGAGDNGGRSRGHGHGGCGKSKTTTTVGQTPTPLLGRPAPGLLETNKPSSVSSGFFKDFPSLAAAAYDDSGKMPPAHETVRKTIKHNNRPDDNQGRHGDAELLANTTAFFRPEIASSSGLIAAPANNAPFTPFPATTRKKNTAPIVLATETDKRPAGDDIMDVSEQKMMQTTAGAAGGETTEGENDGAQYQLTDRDVVMGRGGKANNHFGNQRFLRLKDEIQQQDRYKKATKGEKTVIAQELVDAVHAWGGRFVTMDKATKRWHEVPNVKARKKASQVLRELNIAEVRAAKRAKYAKEAKNPNKP